MASRVHGACDLENDARGAIQKRVRWSARAGGALSGRAAACSHTGGGLAALSRGHARSGHRSHSVRAPTAVPAAVPAGKARRRSLRYLVRGTRCLRCRLLGESSGPRGGGP